MSKVIIDEPKTLQNGLTFRGSFRPKKYSSRWYCQSGNGVIFEWKYFYSSLEADEWCGKANEIMGRIEEIRRTGAKLLFAIQFLKGEDRKKGEDRLIEKEKEIHVIFQEILNI